MSPLMLLTIAIVLVIAFVIVTYNRMIKMRNQADEAWSDIDVQLKRRYNLIPNLVETVKGYAEHESDVFTKVTEARSNAINAGTMKEQAQAENMLSGALKSLFAVAENYPELKANENFMQLQTELVDTEDKIQAARRFYNGTVRDFNTKLQQFPNSVVAKMFKFENKEFFEVEDEEQKKNVEVSFDKEKKEAVPAPVTPPPAPAPVVEKKPAEVAPAEVTAEPAPVTPVEKPELEAPAEEAPELPIKPAPEEKKEEAPAETPTKETPAEEEKSA
ncbi:MAG: LemA family protein [Patescibacteria group bacterium]